MPSIEKQPQIIAPPEASPPENSLFVQNARRAGSFRVFETTMVLVATTLLTITKKEAEHLKALADQRERAEIEVKRQKAALEAARRQQQQQKEAAERAKALAERQRRAADEAKRLAERQRQIAEEAKRAKIEADRIKAEKAAKLAREQAEARKRALDELNRREAQRKGKSSWW